MDELDELFEGLKEVKEKDPYAVVAFGNKADLEIERKVTKEQAEEKLKQAESSAPCELFEVSALTGRGISEGFAALVRQLRTTGFCKCEGKCKCHQKCSQCGISRNLHMLEKHEFKQAKSFCVIL